PPLMTTIERRITMRPFTPGDYAAFVELSNSAYPDYAWTIEEIKHFDQDWKPEGYHRRRIIADEAGVPVGYCEVSHSRGQFVPDNYNIDLVVRPESRRRGIGRALLGDALADLRSRNAHWVRTGVKESEAHSLAFARAIGAIEIKRDWES